MIVDGPGDVERINGGDVVRGSGGDNERGGDADGDETRSGEPGGDVGIASP